MTTEEPESRFVERRSAHVDAEEVPPPLEPERPVAPSETAPAESSRPVATDAVEPSILEQPSVEVDLDEMARVEIPEPSFYEIVQPLEIQALQFLGELPLTADGERRVLPRWAKHIIDLLGVLEERTRGNLTPEEAQYLEQVLADLRLRYVRAAT